MGLEIETGYITDMVGANPVNGDDPTQGASHIRGIKKKVVASFPNIDGAVTATDTELNYVAGVTSAIQTQLDGKQASGSYQTEHANLTDIAAITQTKGDLVVSDGTDFVDVGVGTNDQVLTADSTQASGVKWADLNTIFTESFESSQQTITSAGSLTIAHGLSSTPKHYLAYLVCTDAGGEAGYSQNDEVLVAGGAQAGGTGNRGVSIVPDGTNLNIRYGSDSLALQVIRKDTGFDSGITNSKWKIIFRAWV